MLPETSATEAAAVSRSAIEQAASKDGGANRVSVFFSLFGLSSSTIGTLFSTAAVQLRIRVTISREALGIVPPAR